MDTAPTTPSHHPTPANAGAGLALEGISKRWRNRGGPLIVLDSAHLHVAPGEVAWIGGSNGAGKTTLLRVAAGILLPDAGTVAFGGVSPESDRRTFHRRMGFLSAGDRGLYARLNVLQHLRYFARIAYIPRADRAAAMEAAVREFGLEELLRRRADRLSLGQRQRVRLALTFLHQPTLVLLDEPASSLDEEGGELLRRAVDEVLRRGGLVVWCSPPNERGSLESTIGYRLAEGKVSPE